MNLLIIEVEKIRKTKDKYINENKNTKIGKYRFTIFVFFYNNSFTNKI